MTEVRPSRGQGAQPAIPPDALDTLFEQAPFGVAVIDAELRYRRVNERLAAMHGLAVAEHIGRGVVDVRPGSTGAGIERAVSSVLATGEPVVALRLHGPTAGDPESAREFLCSYLPLPDGVLAIVQDDTDRVAAERERARLLRAAHAAEARTATLQSVTEALNEALGPDEVATRIVAETRRATGAVAGLVAVLEDEALHILHEVGYETDDNRSSLAVTLDTALTRAARDEQPVLLASAAERRAYADAPTFGLEAGAYVPLMYEGHAVGVMALGFSAPGSFDTEERDFLDAVARQCAQALVRAQLYGQLTFLARRLQRQLLPQRMPAVEWLETASSYRALGAGTEVGGDFYDLMPARDGWAALIGDVQGKGVDAAGVAGAARHIIRGLARALDDPAQIVRAANEALMADLDIDRFVTLALVLCTRTANGVRARIASAGHPAPLLRRAGGTVEAIGRPGLIIGVDVHAEYEESRVELAGGDAIVLYTDGIIEARAGGEIFGDRRLRAAIAGAAGDARSTVAAVTRAVHAFEGPLSRDDQAVLCLRAS